MKKTFAVIAAVCFAVALGVFGGIERNMISPGAGALVLLSVVALFGAASWFGGLFYGR